MENTGFLLAAFSIVWAVVFGYILLMVNRQRKLRIEIASLKAVLKEKGIE
jgi:CcmD family protein